MTIQEFRTVSVIAVLVLPWVLNAQELNSTLRSTFYGVKFAYDGENVTFTCIARGSTVIAWSSNDYIGTDLRLEFASVEPVGITRSASRSGTVAQLINSTSEDGGIVLVSRLNILVESTFQISSITCHSIGMDTTNTVSFQMADDASVTCNKPAVCPGETVICSCTTGRSSIIAWTSNQFIGDDGSRLEFASVQPILTRQNASSSNAFAVLAGSSDVNGVVVLESELTFVASESSANILECLNVIRQTSKPIIIPISKNCEAFSPTIVDSSATENIMTTTELDPDTSASPPSTRTDVVAATMIVVLVLATCIITIVILFVFGMKRQRCMCRGRLKGHVEPQPISQVELSCEESKYDHDEQKNTSNNHEDCSEPFNEETPVRPVSETEFGSQRSTSVTRGFGVTAGRQSIVQRSSEERPHMTEIELAPLSTSTKRGFEVMEGGQSMVQCSSEEGPHMTDIELAPLSTSTTRGLEGRHECSIVRRSSEERPHMTRIGLALGVGFDKTERSVSLEEGLLALPVNESKVGSVNKSKPVYCTGSDSLRLELKEKYETEQAVMIDRKEELGILDERSQDLRRELKEKNEKEDEWRQKQLVLESKSSEQELEAEIRTLEIKLQTIQISLIEREQQIKRFQERENSEHALSEMLRELAVGLIEELGSKDSKMVDMKTNFEDFAKDVSKQEKYASGYNWDKRER